MKRNVQASIIFRTSLERAFDTFADPMKMSLFWFHRRDAGLKEGSTVSWYMGPDADAASFSVSIKECKRPSRLVIEWGDDRDRATITWTFEEKGPNSTLVKIEESGFRLEGNALVDRLLDSTGGFNQVIVAAKALAEHDVKINVVVDHA